MKPLDRYRQMGFVLAVPSPDLSLALMAALAGQRVTVMTPPLPDITMTPQDYDHYQRTVVNHNVKMKLAMQGLARSVLDYSPLERRVSAYLDHAQAENYQQAKRRIGKKGGRANPAKASPLIAALSKGLKTR